MRLHTFLAAAFGNFMVVQVAHATAISVVPAYTVAAAPFVLADFGNAGSNGLVSTGPIQLSNGVVSFAQGTASPAAGLYDGNVLNVATSPKATGNYLAAEPGSAITFNFVSPQTQFQLLWGTLDSYNTLAFSLAGNDITSVTGAQVIASGGLNNQSNYVTISGLGAFDKILVTSGSPAFELLPSAQVPEPGTLAILGIGLGGLAWMRRRSA